MIIIVLMKKSSLKIQDSLLGDGLVLAQSSAIGAYSTMDKVVSLTYHWEPGCSLKVLKYWHFITERKIRHGCC